MNRRAVNGILIFLGAVALFYWSMTTKDMPAPIPSQPIAKQDHPSPVPQIFSKPPSVRVTDAKSNDRTYGALYEVANKMGAIYFELEGSTAIFAGDIILGQVDDPQGQKEGVMNPSKIQLWNLPIPYMLAPELPSPERVLKAIQYFNEKTPVKFVPRTNEKDALVFVPADQHCRSYLGQVGELQPVFLSSLCGPGEILHELMHAIGFVHEQSRNDRDQYLEILWSNIEPDKRQQFQKVPDVMMEASSNSDFDFSSIMLYKADTFATNRSLPTMKSKIAKIISPNQDDLSPLDLERLERLYGPRK